MTIKGVLRVLVAVVVLALSIMIGATVTSAQSNEWQSPEFFVAFDKDGSGAVHVPELDEFGEFCIDGFVCEQGEDGLEWFWDGRYDYEVVLYEDGSGWVSVFTEDGLYIGRGEYCLNGWDCAVVEELPNPCEVDPEALPCIPAEEPIILPPPVQWPAQYLYLPVIQSNWSPTVIGQPVCAEDGVVIDC